MFQVKVITPYCIHVIALLASFQTNADSFTPNYLGDLHKAIITQRCIVENLPGQTEASLAS